MVTFLVISAATAFGAGGGFVLPADLTIALPRSGSVQANWLSPPLAADDVRVAGFSGQRFRLDRRASAWMLHNKQNLINLDSGVAFSVARPVNDFVWLDDGALFIAGESSLGIIPPVKADQAPPKKVPQVPFQPVVNLPAQGCQLASDGKDAIFAYGYDPELRGYAIFELVKGFAGWRKLFVANEKIAAVCADGQTLHIAAGRTVYRLRQGDTKAAVAFVHPLDNITGLACGSGNGPFYATARGVGVMSDAGIEFIKSNWTQIEVRDDSLYLFMTESLGVLRLNNIGKLLEKSK